MTTQELTTNFMRMQQEVSRQGELCDQISARLDRFEEGQKEISRLLVSIERLTNGIGGLTEKVGEVDEKVDKLDCRIRQIEQEPGTKWKSFTWGLFMLAAGALVGYILTQVGIQ